MAKWKEAYEKAIVREATQAMELQLIQLWFGTGTDAPLWGVITLADYLLSFGCYGSIINTTVSQLATRVRSPWRFWLLKLKKLYFFSTMQRQYPQLKRLPWPLPVYWIIRIIQTVVRRGGAVKLSIKQFLLSRKSVRKRQDRKQSLGI